MQRRSFVTALVGLPLAARAQAFPAQPIRIYGGFGPGSSSDTIMRLMSPQMQQALGQPILVDNIAGAAGNIASAAVARAKADGYTLLSATNSMLGTNPHLFPRSGVQPASFTPVAALANIGLVVVAGPKAPAATLEGVLEASRKAPVAYGTPGIGTPMHLVGEMLRERSQGDLTHVPYKAGAELVTGLAASQVDIGIVAYTPASGLIRSGQLRPLAVCGTSRLQALPQVPAVAEVVPGVTIGGWCALVAPAGTPTAVCEMIAAAADKALSPAAVQAQLIEIGCDRLKGGPDVVRQLTKTEFDLSGDLVRRLGIHAT